MDDKATITLKNAVRFDHNDKRYVVTADVGVFELPFITRQVLLKFEGVAKLELSIYDMDRLVGAYLSLRQIPVPEGLGTRDAPTKGDMVVGELPSDDC